MKKIITVLLIIVFSKVDAQILVPRVSQKASVYQMIALTDVIINYSRPQVKNRKIFGELEPFGKVWRTGANEVTTISFSTDVKINGFYLKAGRYALVSIPTENDWTFVFNKDADQWGVFDYKDSLDVLKILAKREKISNREILTFSFENVKSSSAEVVFEWENVRASFLIEVDPMTTVSQIKKSISERKPDNWRILSDAANFCYANNINHSEAQQWLDTSIEINKNPNSYFLKAKLFGQVKSNKEAKAFAEVAKEMLKKSDRSNPQLLSEIEEFLKGL